MKRMSLYKEEKSKRKNTLYKWGGEAVQKGKVGRKERGR